MRNVVGAANRGPGGGEVSLLPPACAARGSRLSWGCSVAILGGFAPISAWLFVVQTLNLDIKF
jgi:hypothetical protein